MPPHPGRDVVVKAVDKVHQFDPQQTHSVNLLIHRLFDFHFLSPLQFLSDICEIFQENKQLPQNNSAHPDDQFVFMHVNK